MDFWNVIYVPYNLAFLFNFGPGFFLCNAGEICAMLARQLQQPVIIKKLTSPKQKLPKSDVQTTLHRVFSGAMSSGVSFTTLHKVFTCAILSQEY